MTIAIHNKFILKKHLCAFLHPPRKAKASKEGKRKGSDLTSSMKKPPGGARPHDPCPICGYNYKWMSLVIIIGLVIRIVSQLLI